MKQALAFCLLFLTFGCTKKLKNTQLTGSVFGTTYSIIYDSPIDYQKEMDSLFQIINKAMSTYHKDSDISKINQNKPHTVDSHFTRVFHVSKAIYQQTEGAFDPTIGTLVNAWDFGPEGRIVNLDSLKINRLMDAVGFDKVSLQTNQIIKPKHSFIDFNAIAKGYAVDVVYEFLRATNHRNFLIEIGGEIRVKGINIQKEKPWKVGIEMPHFDGSQSLIKAIMLQDKALATSGTYRKFKRDATGNRYAHIIDTKTGYPSKTNLLSVSVVANDCMSADAYATAFQAMGIEKVNRFLKTKPEIKVFLIFENENKALETLSINGFPED